MGFTVSLVLNHLEHFNAGSGRLELHGANLAISAQIKQFASREEVEALEVFLPPDVVGHQDLLARAAANVLPKERQGKGILRFYPLHALPEIWADGAERIFWSADPEWLPRDRYLRDRFAAGPTPISCDTHMHGFHPMWVALERIAKAPPARFDTLIGLSEAHSEAFRKSFHLLAGDQVCRIETIPRGVDLERFKPSDDEKKRVTRELMRIPQEANVCLYFGRLSPHGKADLMPLVQAFADVASDEDVLVLAGIENVAGYAVRLQELGNQLGLGNRLLIQTRVDPSVRGPFFSSADFFVLPGDTVQEALGNVTLEAMASGLPIVASDWDGFKDTVEEGVTGFLVPTHFMPAMQRIEALSPATHFLQDYMFLAQCLWVDTNALRDSLRVLLRDAEKRKQMGSAARERAEQSYGWPSIMASMFELWREMLVEAREERDELKAARRDYVDRLGLPLPFQALFAHYATRMIEDSDALELTPFGQRVRRGEAQVQFYDETLTVLRPEIVETLLQHLSGPSVSVTVLSVLEGCMRDSKRGRDEILFHLALLMKRDVVKLKEQ